MTDKKLRDLLAILDKPISTNQKKLDLVWSLYTAKSISGLQYTFNTMDVKNTYMQSVNII